ncbi:MAG: peptidoglycan recognition family protein [Leptospirales bacterium]
MTIVLSVGGNYWWEEMRWRYILIHHTASDIGNLDYYKKFHVEQRGWSDIAYHFIVNNGSMNTTIGQIEESDLWKDRKANLSTRNWYANYFGIAVVLVGNFERHKPPPLQQEALITLLTNLARKYDIPPDRIVGHREVQNTACPGKHLNMNEVRAAVKKNL